MQGTPGGGPHRGGGRCISSLKNDQGCAKTLLKNQFVEKLSGIGKRPISSLFGLGRKHGEKVIKKNRSNGQMGATGGRI